MNIKIPCTEYPLQDFSEKKINNIEARAAAFTSDDNQSNVTNIASKDITSASSRDNNLSDGEKTGLQTKLGGAAKGLQI